MVIGIIIVGMLIYNYYTTGRFFVPVETAEQNTTSTKVVEKKEEKPLFPNIKKEIEEKEEALPELEPVKESNGEPVKVEDIDL